MLSRSATSTLRLSSSATNRGVLTTAMTNGATTIQMSIKPHRCLSHNCPCRQNFLARRNFSTTAAVVKQQQEAPTATATTTSSILSNFTEPDQSYHNISVKPFSDSTQTVLMEPVRDDDVEIKPDGIIYLPEIKYRRILNKAFGPGGWGLMPRGNYIIHNGSICQQYALFCHGQFVSQAWGDQLYDDSTASHKSLASALEGVKSNALMRCCKDLGVASELWDPSFILKWKAEHCVEVWAVHYKTGQRKKLYRRKDRPAFEYPYSEEKAAAQQATGKSSSPPSSSSRGKTSNSTVAAVDGEQQVQEPTMTAVEEDRTVSLEDGDVDMFDVFQNDMDLEAKKSGDLQSMDWSETIKFGKFSGQTWEQAMSQPSFKSWAKWMTNQGKAPPQVKLALQMLEKQA